MAALHNIRNAVMHWKLKRMGATRLALQAFVNLVRHTVQFPKRMEGDTESITTTTFESDDHYCHPRSRSEFLSSLPELNGVDLPLHRQWCDLCNLRYTVNIDARHRTENPTVLVCGHDFGRDCLAVWTEESRPGADACPACAAPLWLPQSPSLSLVLRYSRNSSSEWWSVGGSGERPDTVAADRETLGSMSEARYIRIVLEHPNSFGLQVDAALRMRHRGIPEMRPTVRYALNMYQAGVPVLGTAELDRYEETAKFEEEMTSEPRRMLILCERALVRAVGMELLRRDRKCVNPMALFVDMCLTAENLFWIYVRKWDSKIPHISFTGLVEEVGWPLVRQNIFDMLSAVVYFICLCPTSEAVFAKVYANREKLHKRIME